MASIEKVDVLPQLNQDSLPPLPSTTVTKCLLSKDVWAGEPMKHLVVGYFIVANAQAGSWQPIKVETVLKMVGLDWELMESGWESKYELATVYPHTLALEGYLKMLQLGDDYYLIPTEKFTRIWKHVVCFENSEPKK